MSDNTKEERRKNIGASCDLYDKCLQMHSGWNLFASEVTNVKNALEDVQKSEDEAVEKREETHSKIDSVDRKLDAHMKEFKDHGTEEMETVRQQTEALAKLTDSLERLNKSHIEEKQDQQWMKKFGYTVATIFGGALLWLFTNANNTDKLIAEMSTNIKHQTEMTKELKSYFRGDVR